jgi:hypothetical protein
MYFFVVERKMCVKLLLSQEEKPYDVALRD